MTERRAPRPRRAFRGEVRADRTPHPPPGAGRARRGRACAGSSAGEFTDHYVKLLFPPPGVPTPSRSTSRRSAPSCPASSGRACAPTPCAAGTPRPASSPSTSSTTATRASPVRGRRRPSRATCSAFSAPAARTRPTRRRAGTCSPATRARCPRSPPRSSASRRTRAPTPSSRSPGPRTRSSSTRPPARDVTWLHRDGARSATGSWRRCASSSCRPASRTPSCTARPGFVKELRRHLRVERGLPLDRLSISGYWRRGVDEDGWQSAKREWNRRVSEEEAAALAS